jgi:hypothetical protein
MAAAPPTVAVALLVIPAVAVRGLPTRLEPDHPAPADLECASPDASMSAGSNPHSAVHRAP